MSIEESLEFKRTHTHTHLPNIRNEKETERTIEYKREKKNNKRESYRRKHNEQDEASL